jgi:NAD(P)-dependent dehydrogenase (short-subunit alcohol dehydrogenase family)
MPHVMITGTSSGLGECLKTLFAAEGHAVTGTTHDPRLASDDQMFYDAREELGHMKLVTSMAALGVARKGPVDLLINNAGINAIRHFEDLTLDFLEDVMRVNCFAPMLLVRELLAMQKFSPGAVVVNIVSDAAWRPMRHSAAYNAAKAALDMATRQMARELTKPKDMVILAVRPGKMKGTGMSAYIDRQVQELRGWTEAEARAYFVNNSVTGREADPKDVAQFIYNLYHNPLIMTMSGACLDLVG